MEMVENRLRRAGMERQELSLLDRVGLLAKSKMGKDMGQQELQTLAEYCRPWLAKPQTVLFRQGENSDFMCLICKGRVAVIKEDLHHTQKEIATVGPSQTVGEMSMIDREPRSATVITQTAVQLLVLDEEGFERMSEEVPRLWGKIVLRMASTLSRRLRQTSGILAEYLSV